MNRTKPPWLKVKAPGGERYTWIKNQARELGLHTVCEEAHCPNIGECWSSGTATFMVMSDICTRGCRFCAVNTKRIGPPLDPDEPAKLSQTIAAMGLDYVVVTSVNRDDLEDQGANHFAECIRAIRANSPQTLIEVLIPDFQGRHDLVQHVIDARPEVIAHNIETVERLTPRVRDRRAGYRQSLDVLQAIKTAEPELATKSSIMVGVGETDDEVIAAMADLRAVGCDFLTIGQYLQPSKKHLNVDAFVTPEQFERYRTLGEGLGFRYVASGPLVRSSYKAGEFFIRQHLNERMAT
ncbi:MAG: lipoyl synthase [Myxococcota bacterium]|nr:lipoyl synthase [Myxococcota bacterium]MEC9388676.1 lipoyl synthase [Myxococcota bacterium]